MVTIPSSCQLCGRELGDARPMIVCGRTFTFGPTVCDACAAARKAEAQRNERSRWERLCPKLYQCTNIVRLEDDLRRHGWSFDGYDDFTHKLDDVNLVDLLPIDGTPKGDLAKAEALYDGDAGNLIRLRAFSGDLGSEMPLHSIIVGAKGSGKSLLVNDILTQTEPNYDYTVIVDNGLSYGVYTQYVEEGAAPIVIRSTGNYTFNPFDTRGLPLNNESLSSITALLSLLAGWADNPEKRRYREALMTSQVREIFSDYYRRYRREHEERLAEIAREALCVERWHKERSSDGDGFVDAFVEFREFKEREPEKAREELARYTGSEIAAFVENPRSEALLGNMVFAYFRPEEFPSLHDVQDEIQARGRQRPATPESQEYAILGKLLEVWLRDGPYGPIVDGVTNIDLRRRIVHFELGKIKESEQELLAVAGFLITNDVRNYIMLMRRGLRKRLILESSPTSWAWITGRKWRGISGSG